MEHTKRLAFFDRYFTSWSFSQSLLIESRNPTREKEAFVMSVKDKGKEKVNNYLKMLDKIKDGMKNNYITKTEISGAINNGNHGDILNASKIKGWKDIKNR